MHFDYAIDMVFSHTANIESVSALSDIAVAISDNDAKPRLGHSLLTHMLVSRVWIPGCVFSFPGIGNQEMSFPEFQGAREWRLLQYY